MKKRICAAALAVWITAGAAGCAARPAVQKEQAVSDHQVQESQSAVSLSHEGYTLEKVVILSRYNIRSPLSSRDSVIGQATPHEWITWSSAPSELSLRGGAVETIIGQYFRKWLEQEGLFPENYRPEGSEVRFYSNSKQRTIATANYFKTGLLPTADVPVEYHMQFDEMDPVFTPQLTFTSPEYEEAVRAQVNEMFADKIHALKDNYDLLSRVIDLDQSPAYAEGTLTGFSTDDTQIVLEIDQEPTASGALKTGCSISDALVLQYYEQPNDLQAAFGHRISFEDWQTISEIKDLYIDYLFTSPLIAPNAAHPLLMEIDQELQNEDRKFTFLCGHDSNLASVLASLQVEEYRLPDAVEAKTPIGTKIVFTKWSDSSRNEYISCDLVYPSSEQLRQNSLMDLEHSPMVFPLQFEELSRNQDGLYAAKDVAGRLTSAIAAYDVIVDEYGMAAAA